MAQACGAALDVSATDAAFGTPNSARSIHTQRTTLHYIVRQEITMPAALKDSQLSLRLPNDLKDKMQAYAQLTGRTKSYVAMEALGSYLDWRLPQIEDLKAAVLAADQGDFASDEEVATVLARQTRRKAPRAAAKPATRRRAA